MAPRAPKRWTVWPMPVHAGDRRAAHHASLHRRILADPRFIAGGVDTGFLAGFPEGRAMTERVSSIVTMRDGNQSLWGPPASTPRTCSAAALTEACGFPRDRFHLVEPHGRGRPLFPRQPVGTPPPMHAAMPTTPLQFITTGLRFIAWQQADPSSCGWSIASSSATGGPLRAARSDARSAGRDRGRPAGEAGRRSEVMAR
jgi:hypothetical protein